MGTPLHFTHIPERNGACSIWEPPQPGRDYVLAGDAAGGGARTDPAVGLVIDAETCDICAIWREQASPIPFGRALFGLGQHYNGALLAIETYPSAHGLAAYHELMRMNYSRLYVRITQDRVQKTRSTQLGWRNDITTNPLMVSRVKEWLNESHEVLSEELLGELRAAYWDKMEKVKSSGTDDIFDALAIALMVRDDAWYRQELRPHRPGPMTIDDMVWASLKAPEVVKRRQAL